jgi:hypothetical protein
MTFYRNGDLCKYTGKSEMLHGAMCYEFEYLDGHKAGTFGWTYHAPK